MQGAIRRASCGHCKDESKSGERATDQPRKSCLCRSIGLAARDNPTFTYMNGTGVMIAGQLFNHLLYHFTLTLFELGKRDGLFLGVVREPVGGTTKVASGRVDGSGDNW